MDGKTIDFIIASFNKPYNEKIKDMQVYINQLQANDALRNMLGIDPRFTKEMARELLHLCKSEFVVHGGPLITFLKKY